MGTLKTVTDAASEVRSTLSELRPELTENLIPGIGHTLREINRTADQTSFAAGAVVKAITTDSDRIANAVELACWTIAAGFVVLVIRELFR